MRPRWHDRVIVLAIVALAVAGVWTLWGDELVRLFRDEPPAEAAAPSEVTPPPGQAAAPY
jgi:hypothetical protein